MTSSIDCLFCNIVSGNIPCEEVAQSDKAFAFRDINPAAPEHVLIIPKRHTTNAARMGQDHPEDLQAVFALAREVAEQLGLQESGYRLVFNTGSDGGQTVFHTHLHLLGGRALGWPPG